MDEDKNKLKTYIIIDTGESEIDLNKVTDALENLNKQGQKVDESIEKNTKSIDKMSKAFKSATAGLKSIANGFKGIGLAVKAMGIGLALEAFAALKEIFMSNQKVIDAVSTAMNFLKIAFNDLVSFLTDNTKPIVDFFKNVFENPKQSLIDFSNLIKDNLIERFKSLLDMFGYLGSALKNLMKGDFDAAVESVKASGKELIDVVTGVNNTFDRSIGPIVDYTTKTWKAAEAVTKLNNQVTIAIANNNKLKEQYDKQAEQLRQIRDDDTRNISERIKANNDLAKVLDEQSKLMVKGADLAIKKARIDYNLNDSIENKVKLIEAETEKAAILAQIEGLRSEQKANEISLTKEQIEIGQKQSDGNAERARKDAEFASEFIKNELQKLETQKQVALEQGRLDEERLKKKMESYNKETIAYADAQNEYLNKVQENAQNQIKIDEDIANAKKKLADAEKENRSKSLDSAADSMSQFAELAGEQTTLGKGLAIASTTIETYQSATKAFNSMAGIPYVGPVLGGIAAAAAVASGIANVKRILSVKTPGSSGGSAPTPTQVNTSSLPKFTPAQLQSVGKAEPLPVQSGSTKQEVILTNDSIVKGNQVEVDNKNLRTLK